MAKAPSLWKYGVQRVVGEQSTQRTRKLSTSYLVYAGEMESNMGGLLWNWRNGNRRFMDLHGERSQVLSRMR